MVDLPGGTYTQEGENNIGDLGSFSHTIHSFQIGKNEITYELWYNVYQWGIRNGYNPMRKN